jgi:hypothetical protein
MIHLASSLPSGVLKPWVLFMLGVIPVNLLWARVGDIVRSKGLELRYLNIYVLEGLRNFHRIIREEQDPHRKASYRRLAVAMYLCDAWCLFWFIAFVVA